MTSNCMRAADLRIRPVAVGSLLIVWLTSIWFLSGCSDSITPAARTYTNVCQIRRAVNEFVAAYNRPPSSLDELVNSDPSIRNSCRDGWGVPLAFRIQAPEVGIISTPSKYRSSDGNHPELDLVWTFALKDSSGQWIGTNFGSWGWLSNPFMTGRADVSTNGLKR